MKRFTVFLLLLVLLTASLPAHVRAQDGADGCTADDVAAYLDDLDAASAAVRAALDAGDDPAGALAALHNAATAYYALRATCSGLAFEGMGGDVLGPVEFHAGLYRATLRAQVAILMLDVLEGNCEFTNYTGPAAMSMSGPVESEAVFNSQGCTTLITVDQTLAGAWSLTFEKLN